MAVNIRFAQARDIPHLLRFIDGLAQYQHMEDEVTVTPELLEKWVFTEKMAEVLLAELDGEPVGFALFFPTFSAFPGLPGLYLQDLFVDPACRGAGCGKALMEALARTACERGYGSVEWACLDWNQPSIDFYCSLGAKPMQDWTNYNLSGDALRALASEALHPAPAQ
ncbi:GNAT family N-acetyltransferase [Butyricicoccus sp. 1XD8-22]|nr:GNAT family N-acetyltransferase [Butyricicoccus sp. 1XD8-22]